MQDNNIKKIAIVGGGSAGWMTAAALSKMFGQVMDITLVESEQIGTVGVGEATIPPIKFFNHFLGIQEPDFLRFTKATYKLAIEFDGWHKDMGSYYHPFDNSGTRIGEEDFLHYWVKAHRHGEGLVENYDEYSLAVQMCNQHKFQHPAQDKQQFFSQFSYAYHFDASLYAKFLRGLSERNGVTRIEGMVEDVVLNPGNGHIDHIKLKDETRIDADLFIDCTGFRGLLIEQALKTGYEDWSHWLPCDSAIAVPSEGDGKIWAHTRATARDAGWQWRIPLQHRVGNGHVFCSKFMQAEQAEKILLDNIDGKPLADPKLIRFKTGHRKKIWNKNCVAIGLSAGFLEPLESTSLHLIQSSIMRLIKHFPDKDLDPVVVNHFNDQSLQEYIDVKDFLILHYCTTGRMDTEFWRYCSTMDIPDSLKDAIGLFESYGYMPPSASDERMFRPPSWEAVMVGQGVIPKKVLPSLSQMPIDKLQHAMQTMPGHLRDLAKQVPDHADYIEQLLKHTQK